VAAERAAAVAAGDPNAGLPTEWAGSKPTPTGRRKTSIPVVEIARAEFKDEAMAGFERWKARHADIAGYLEPPDVLVDGMRGRSAVWYRVRVNLIHVPEDRRPGQEPLESDFDPWAGMDIEAWKAATSGSRARRPAPKSKPPAEPDSSA
jgi:bifunctional non-homologous end joining protein LigD